MVMGWGRVNSFPTPATPRGIPHVSGEVRGIPVFTIPAFPIWEETRAWHTGVVGPKEVEGAVASGAGDKSLVGGSGWGQASVLSRGNRTEEEKDST